jgi:ABC-type antimicrobial peptide transport system permease subunit
MANLLLFDPFFETMFESQILNLTDHSLTDNLVFQGREKIYDSSDSIRRSVIEMSNELYQGLGKNHSSTPTVPLAIAMNGFLIIKNFLDNMVFSATFLLLLLSALLIYSLMIGDVEEKAYEFGMLRALGFDKRWLIVLLLLEALVFAVPGLILGLLSSYLLNSIIGVVIFSSTVLFSSYALTTDAIILGAALGLAMPLISNVLPILRALSKTLRDSLDLYHRVLNEASVQVLKLERMGLSLDQTLIALLLVIMGFVSYYLAPLAFVF